MATIGEFLKQKRMEQGISLEQAAHATRVRVHYLRALEEDEREVLPSVVQGRGYLRLYADYLKVDARCLLDGWDANYIADEVPVEDSRADEMAPEVVGEPEPEAEPEPEPELQAVEVERVFLPTPPIEVEQPAAPETASQGVFIEVGQRLRSQREALGITLADTEKFTHIRQNYIHALEKGALDELPSPVQGRGMLSNYARFLNMDADGLLDRFADGLQLRREERMQGAVDVRVRSAPAFTARNSQPQPGPQAVKSTILRRLVTPDLLIGGGLLVLMVIFFIWGASKLGKNPETADGLTPTPPSIAEVLQYTAVPSEMPMAEGTVTPMPTNAPVTIGEAPISTVVGTAVNTDPLQVYIVARQRAWLRVTVDGKVAFEGRAIPGNAYPFSGKERIELLTGNAGGLQVLFNQMDMGTLGGVGQVVSLDFSPEGVITPTSAFSPTPTITPRPTLTPQPTEVQPTPTITPFIP